MKRLIILIPYFVIAVLAAGLLWYAADVNPAVPVQTDPCNSYPLVIIDAGHGGCDGGAVAKDGTEEQYINLDIALKVNNILNVCGFKTLLTRSDNNSIHDADKQTIRDQKVSDIHNRLKIIQDNPDCIFLSIHQNYFTESRYSGTQVFYSPNDPESAVLAEYIQTNVASQLQPDNTRKIKPSGRSIYLLYYSQETSVLVECGFLSNEQETEKLKTDDYRMQMAMSVSGGLMNYLFDKINNGATEQLTDITHF